MTHGSWSVLIVDDEPPIRAELRYLLESDGRVGVIDEAGNGTEAIAKILADRPDILFLDIQMPGTSGMKIAEALRSLKIPPQIVFVTAFAEYAAEAFELDAIDYVLKPVEMSRLERALDKAAAILDSRRMNRGETRRIVAQRGGSKVFIPASDVRFIEAKADYSIAVCKSGSYLVGESISVLERELCGDGFVRTHRSYLVNIDHVRDIKIPRGGTMELRLEGVDVPVPVSRRRAAEVKGMLGIA